MKILKFNCPFCEKGHTATEDMIGSEFDCLECGEEITVPDPQEHEDVDVRVAVCSDCGKPLDLMGECNGCLNKAQEYAAHKAAEDPPQRKTSSRRRKGAAKDPFDKVMNARMKGMKNIVNSIEKSNNPKAEQKKESGPSSRVRRKRRR